MNFHPPGFFEPELCSFRLIPDGLMERNTEIFWQLSKGGFDMIWPSRWSNMWMEKTGFYHQEYRFKKSIMESSMEMMLCFFFTGRPCFSRSRFGEILTKSRNTSSSSGQYPFIVCISGCWCLQVQPLIWKPNMYDHPHGDWKQEICRNRKPKSTKYVLHVCFDLCLDHTVVWWWLCIFLHFMTWRFPAGDIHHVSGLIWSKICTAQIHATQVFQGWKELTIHWILTNYQLREWSCWKHFFMETSDQHPWTELDTGVWPINETHVLSMLTS